MRRLAALALLAACWPVSSWGAQPQFWRIEGARDFLEGTTEGISVDSQGRARLGLASSVVQDPESPYVWCLAWDGKGALYAGTGNPASQKQHPRTDAQIKIDIDPASPTFGKIVDEQRGTSDSYPAPADIEFRDGRFHIAGTDRSLALSELAAREATRRIRVSATQTPSTRPRIGMPRLL